MLYQRKLMANNQKGQSTVEFIISMSLMFSFVFLFVSIAYNFTQGYLMHWSTYKAGRHFLVFERNSNSDPTSDQRALDEARDVFEASGLSEDFITNRTRGLQARMPGDQSGLVGVFVEFEQRLSLFSYLGGSEEIGLISEAYLGREPTKIECMERVCRAMDSSGNCGNLAATYFDNGC